MNIRSQIIAELKSAFPRLREKYPIGSLALFGSATREDFDPEKSDIDILVDYTSSDVLLFLSLADELERLLGKKVDLITKRSLKDRQWNYLKDKLVYV